MITAKEAGAISDRFDAECNLKPFEDIVKHCANNGMRTAQIDLSKFHFSDPFIGLMIAKLEKLGYLVKRDSGFDPREQISWNYLYISW